MTSFRRRWGSQACRPSSGLLLRGSRETRATGGTIRFADRRESGADFRPYPRRTLAIGADADIALLDPNATWTVTVADALHKQKWTPYEGKEITGRVVRTIRRGETIFDDRRQGDDRVTARPGPEDSCAAATGDDVTLNTDANGRWIDPRRVESSIQELSQYGAHGETGVARLVYSPEWIAAQDQVAGWMEESGLRVERDAVGNVWGFLDGRDRERPIVATGSHIDSQNPGGRFDGALGVVAGILAVGALRERHGQPRQTIGVVSLVEEEASRFPTANFWGSRAIVGRIGPDEPRRLRGYDGVTMAEAMRDAGLDPARLEEARRDDVETFVELHIEQGPFLEHEDVPVGIVERITGYRQFLITLEGSANRRHHADGSATRPDGRRAEIIGVIDTAHRMGRPA